MATLAGHEESPAIAALPSLMLVDVAAPQRLAASASWATTSGLRPPRKIWEVKTRTIGAPGEPVQQAVWRS
jgi:hypothetical protein